MSWEILISVLVFSPLLGSVLNTLFGRYWKGFSGAIGTLLSFVAFAASVFAYLQFHPLERQDAQIVTLFNWVEVGNFKADLAYQVDQLSLFMALIITGIGSLIHLYSIGYMKGNPGIGRFFSYLNLFVFFMLHLVLAENLVVLFFGWEGVGLCSYLLIGFDTHKENAAQASIKAFVTNRIADLAMIGGIALTYWLSGSVSFIAISESLPQAKFLLNALPFVAICFFIGAMGKSAQFPFHVWLPDAMAGPTPVSALIHAATMVTAGLFLIARLNFIFILVPKVGFWIVCIGTFTAFFAATIGVYQNDIKKVLAYSTVSQLGYMFVAMGTGAYVAGLFHLLTHAFFKALLFLGSGSVIHGLSDEQDLRRMGGLKDQMKITWWTFLLGTLAIVGAPPFSGFFSKDLILEKAFYFHPVFFGMGIATAFLTTFYMFRLTFLAFTGKSRVSSHVHPHESPWTMTVPLVILALGAAFSGYLLVPESLGGGIDFLEKYFSPVFAKGLLYYSQQQGALEVHHLSHELELLLAGFSLGAILLGVGIYWFFFGKKEKLPSDESSYTGWRILPANKYYIDEIFKNVLIGPISAFSEFLSEVVEKRLIDKVLTGTGKFSGGISSFLRRIQTGTVVDYAFLIVLGTVLILSVFLWRGI
ncbi:NADH-quinone oxidoreductase subunit L [Leptospira hartskeerlii]|uniref:NADH-quinone oxidoreductase subunit L n=1 Tax=Leptospira hartskeerlii TaxID=2023177 RepID=A0A2M9XFX6_9LEPT|nr:NADH-quinone oxidoreductase subunit L [Leptospira hartskeerlii]PJZ26580.1 NADH-quinone oxidoreductase subunit L [Leptospira hartskeerlii]PJZ34937.1 NADH-quinone oxidoreductase subunit L [Leptospira hartskeerlii]